MSNVSMMFVGEITDIIDATGYAGAIELILGALGLAWAIFAVYRARAGCPLHPVLAVAPLLVQLVLVPFGALTIERETPGILVRVEPDQYVAVWAKVLDRAWHVLPGVAFLAALPASLVILLGMPFGRGPWRRSLAVWAAAAGVALVAVAVRVAGSLWEPDLFAMGVALLALPRAAWAIVPEVQGEVALRRRRTLALAVAVVASLLLLAFIAGSQVLVYRDMAFVSADQKAAMLRREMDDDRPSLHRRGGRRARRLGVRVHARHPRAGHRRGRVRGARDVDGRGLPRRGPGAGARPPRGVQRAAVGRLGRVKPEAHLDSDLPRGGARLPRTTEAIADWLGVEQHEDLIGIRLWQGDAAVVRALEAVADVAPEERARRFFLMLKDDKRARQASATWPKANYRDWYEAGGRLRDAPILEHPASPPPQAPWRRAQALALSEDELAAVQELLGYGFGTRSLLTRALRHSSAGIDHNDSLACLGDRIYGAWAARRAYASASAPAKGAMTDAIVSLCREETQAAVFFDLGLHAFLVVGGSVEGNGGWITSAMASTALEALVAAIELDGGPEAAEAFLDRACGALVAGNPNADEPGAASGT